jgi:anti-sigma regulatory factor (Ser/Thr protein kinase)
MDGQGIDQPTREDLVLAVNELATNGIEASPADVVEVEAQRAGDVLRVAVVNEGPPFDGLKGRTDPHSSRGRGLDLATALTDSIAFGPNDGGTAVTLTKRLR